MLILFYYYLIEILNKYYKYINLFKISYKKCSCTSSFDIVYILKLLLD